MKRLVTISLILSAVACVPAEQSDPSTVSESFIQELSITTVTNSDADGTASASCDTGSVVVGGGCWCTGIGENAGMLFACMPTPGGNSYGGACYDARPEGSSGIEVYAICLRNVNAEAITALNKPQGQIESTVEQLDSMKAMRNP